MEEKGLHSAKLGLFVLLQNMHFRHPWRSGIKPRRQGDKFPCEALGVSNDFKRQVNNIALWRSFFFRPLVYIDRLAHIVWVIRSDFRAPAR